MFFQLAQRHRGKRGICTLLTTQKGGLREVADPQQAQIAVVDIGTIFQARSLPPVVVVVADHEPDWEAAKDFRAVFSGVLLRCDSATLPEMLSEAMQWVHPGKATEQEHKH